MYKFSLMLLMQLIFASSVFYGASMDEEMEERNERLFIAPAPFNPDTMDEEMRNGFLPHLDESSTSSKDIPHALRTKRIWKSCSSSSAQFHTPFYGAAASDRNEPDATPSPGSVRANSRQEIPLSEFVVHSGYLEIKTDPNDPSDLKLKHLGVRIPTELGEMSVNARLKSVALSPFVWQRHSTITEEEILCTIILPYREDGISFGLNAKFLCPDGMVRLDQGIPCLATDQGFSHSQTNSIRLIPRIKNGVVSLHLECINAKLQELIKNLPDLLLATPEYVKLAELMTCGTPSEGVFFIFPKLSSFQAP